MTEMNNFIFPDVSHHKQDLDMQKFAAIGARLVISKASDSYHMPDKNGQYDFAADRHFDAYFVQNFQRTRAAGLYAAHYHFARAYIPGVNMLAIAMKNLKHYTDALGMLVDAGTPQEEIFSIGILDAEQPSSQLTGAKKEDVSDITLETAYAFADVFDRLIFYSGSWWTDMWMLDSDLEKIAEIAAVWEPEYRAGELASATNGYGYRDAGLPNPSVPHMFDNRFIEDPDLNWNGFLFAHQYTDRARIPGITSNIDMNRTQIRKEDLGWLLGQDGHVDPPGNGGTPLEGDDLVYAVSLLQSHAEDIIDISDTILNGVDWEDLPDDDDDPIINPPEEEDNDDPTVDQPLWMGWKDKPREDWPVEVEGSKVGYAYPSEDIPLMVVNPKDMTFTPYESEALRGLSNTNGKRIIAKAGQPIMVFARGDEFAKALDKNIRPFNSWEVSDLSGATARRKFDGGRVAYIVMREQSKDGIDLWNGLPEDAEEFVTLFVPQDKLAKLYNPSSDIEVFPEA